MEWSLNSLWQNSRMTSDLYFRVFLVALLFFSAGCKNEQDKDDPEFYYYPRKNVYYDPLKKDFWYSLNGAKTWSTFKNNNNAEPSNLGEKVVIRSRNAEVFKDNEDHRKIYAGRLYLINADAANAAAVPEVSERKVVQKRTTQTSRRRTTAKPKNNIGKFIDKIFGKAR